MASRLHRGSCACSIAAHDARLPAKGHMFEVSMKKSKATGFGFRLNRKP